MSLFWLFKAGGPVMWPLLLSLLIGVGFSVERGIAFWTGSINAREFMVKIDAHVAKGDIKGALALCEATRGPIAAVIKAGLLRWDKGRKQVEKAIETAGSGAMSKLERGLTVLASVANIAPLLGFLGTVTGMIRSFGVIAKAGLSDPGLVAAGISEALITTAAGLIIAIPVLSAYNYFTSVVAKSALQMDESTSQLLDHLK
ncbi:MAG: MotA/TolQ/ExbB proton channel family protein [Candidatus Coatesbacteria bacterium]|nr:MotA/TolQ/ExbB proton channel family protein [Candidatus Coatesbacteria bacterium]